jgi:hypothetical protein
MPDACFSSRESTGCLNYGFLPFLKYTEAHGVFGFSILQHPMCASNMGLTSGILNCVEHKGAVCCMPDVLSCRIFGKEKAISPFLTRMDYAPWKRSPGLFFAVVMISSQPPVVQRGFSP